MEKDFAGKATSRVCRVSYRNEAAVRVIDLDVEFDWDDVSTEHDRRDQRMREHFQRDGFERILGTARGVPVSMLNGAGPDHPVTIPISMTIGGVTNQVHGLVTLPMTMTDGWMGLDVELKVSQEKFDYDPITLLGFMSVRDEVVVQARFNLPPDPVPATPVPER